MKLKIKVNIAKEEISFGPAIYNQFGLQESSEFKNMIDGGFEFRFNAEQRAVYASYWMDGNANILLAAKHKKRYVIREDHQGDSLYKIAVKRHHPNCSFPTVRSIIALLINCYAPDGRIFELEFVDPVYIGQVLSHKLTLIEKE